LLGGGVVVHQNPPEVTELFVGVEKRKTIGRCRRRREQRISGGEEVP
jgi:hypothetical protein